MTSTMQVLCTCQILRFVENGIVLELFKHGNKPVFFQTSTITSTHSNQPTILSIYHPLNETPALNHNFQLHQSPHNYINQHGIHTDRLRRIDPARPHRTPASAHHVRGLLCS